MTISGTGATWDGVGEGLQDDIVYAVVENGITRLGKSSFIECYRLKSVILPESLSVLGTSCFTWCSSLESVTIPASVTSLEQSCFKGCTSLT